jgi:hypothetical protein
MGLSEALLALPLQAMAFARFSSGMSGPARATRYICRGYANPRILPTPHFILHRLPEARQPWQLPATACWPCSRSSPTSPIFCRRTPRRILNPRQVSSQALRAPIQSQFHLAQSGVAWLVSWALVYPSSQCRSSSQGIAPSSPPLRLVSPVPTFPPVLIYFRPDLDLSRASSVCPSDIVSSDYLGHNLAAL